jgi:hypothetical protein
MDQPRPKPTRNTTRYPLNRGRPEHSPHLQASQTHSAPARPRPQWSDQRRRTHPCPAGPRTTICGLGMPSISAPTPTLDSLGTARISRPAIRSAVSTACRTWRPNPIPEPMLNETHPDPAAMPSTPQNANGILRPRTFRNPTLYSRPTSPIHPPGIPQTPKPAQLPGAALPHSRLRAASAERLNMFNPHSACPCPDPGLDPFPHP